MPIEALTALLRMRSGSRLAAASAAAAAAAPRARRHRRRGNGGPGRRGGEGAGVGLEQRRVATAQRLQQVAVEHVAEIEAELVVALPLRFVEELVGGGLLREGRVAGGEVDQVDRQPGADVGLDQHQPARLGRADVAHTGEREAGVALARGQIVERAEQLDPGRSIVLARCAGTRAQELDLRAEVDARLAHQVLQVAEAVVRVGAAVGEHDHAAAFGEQGVGGRVLEVAAIAEEPVGSAAALEVAEHLAEQAA
jgi:hypothetical protein